MQKSWLLSPRSYSPALRLQLTPQSRWLHIRKLRGFESQEERSPQKTESSSLSKKDAESPISERKNLPADYHKPSLLEELFPEEIDNRNNNGTEYGSEDLRVPRLSLPYPNPEDELQSESGIQGRTKPDETSRGASKEAYRQWNLTVLVARRASKSLDESDFRRIAPKGHHIEDWKGPGDFLKGKHSF